MARGDRDRAIAFALSMHPDRIGVGRLCQELLAEVTRKPVRCRAEKPVRINALTGRRACKLESVK